MKYFTYVLKSKKDNTLYIGISKNPDVRLKEHNFGDSKYTKGHRPYELIHQEEFPSRMRQEIERSFLNLAKAENS